MGAARVPMLIRGGRRRIATTAQGDMGTRRDERICLRAGRPVWACVVLALAFEAFTTWMIRDGLALNVLMLLYPLEAVKAWQGAG